MDKYNVILVFGALEQPKRLDVFRLMVRHEPDGLPVGEIAPATAVKQNTMSTHLAILARAGLVNGAGRQLSLGRTDLPL